MNTITSLNRRSFLKATALATGLVEGIPLNLLGAGEPSAAKLPRWRGFNLLEKFTRRRQGNPPFVESGFQMMQERRFDFARLPMSYQRWSEPGPKRRLQVDEANLKHVDQAVAFERRHDVHVNLNLHRAPGYCVNPPRGPLDLWKDQRALDASARHWTAFARRYRGVPNRELSFDLLNEPANVPVKTYVRVVRQLVAAIRAEDPQRLIAADGLKWGRDPVFGLADFGVAQSTRGYDPCESATTGRVASTDRGKPHPRVGATSRSTWIPRRSWPSGRRRRFISRTLASRKPIERNSHETPARTRPLTRFRLDPFDCGRRIPSIGNRDGNRGARQRRQSPASAAARRTR